MALAQNETHEQAKAIIEQLREFALEEIGREEVLGTAFSFNDVVDDAEQVITLFRSFPLERLEELPVREVEKIRNLGHQIITDLEAIRAFEPADKDNVKGARDQLARKFGQTRDKMFSQLLPVIAYLGRSPSSDATTAAISEQVAEYLAQETEARQKQLDVAIGSAERQSSEIGDILALAKKAAGEVGVTSQGESFAKEAQNQDRKAKHWGVAVITAIFATLGFSILAFLPAVKATPDPGLPIAQAIQLLGTKIFIFAIFTYAIVLASRNFLSHKHNAIVNRHRHHALVTYGAILSASKDENAREIILSHAAMCIFSPQETGLNKHGTGAAMSAANLEPLLRIMTKNN